MLCVEFDDGTRAVLQDEVATRVIGVDGDGDLLVETGPLLPGVHRELRALTPCCHHLAVATEYEKTGAACGLCQQVVSNKYIVPNKVRTPARIIGSVEEAVRQVYKDKSVNDDEIKRAVEFLLQECVVHA